MMSFTVFPVLLFKTQLKTLEASGICLYAILVDTRHLGLSVHTGQLGEWTP